MTAAKAATLIDDFSTNDLSSLWTGSFGTVTWSAGKVGINCDSSYDAALESSVAYDLTSSSIFAKMSPYISSTGAMYLTVEAPGGGGTTQVFCGIEGDGSGGHQAIFSYKISGTTTNVSTTTYNATNHAWMRLREASGTIYCDAAPDGKTWTNLGSVATATPTLDLTNVSIIVGSGHWGGEADGTSYVSNFNIGTPSGSVTIKLKKMKVVGTSTEKSFVTAPIKLKKIKVVGASTEKSLATAPIKLKKMKVVGTSTEKSFVTAPIKLKKMVVKATDTFVIKNNFEGVSSGTTLTAANSGGASGNAFDAFSIPAAGILAADNTHAAHGSVSLKVATTTTTGVVTAQWKLATLGTARNKLYFRVNLYISAAATPAWRPFAYRTSASGHIFSPLVSGNAIQMSYGTGFTGITFFTSTIPNNTWFRIEGYVDTVAGSIYAAYYNSVDSGTITEQHTYTGLTIPGPIDHIDVGNQNGATSDGPFWLDDVAFSVNSLMGPAYAFATAAVKLKKMVISGASTEKSLLTSAIKLKKMKLSGASTEKSLLTSAIKLKKMKLSGASTEKSLLTSAIKLKKMKLVGRENPKLSGQIKLKKMKLSATAADSPRRISWDDSGRFYSQGVSNGVLYPKNSPGVAWNGLVSVTEKSGDASTSLYIDGQLYRNRLVPSAFAGTISAFMYPDEFEQYIGVIKGITAQKKAAFGFSYRTSNEIHIVYSATAAPSSDSYATIGDSVSPVIFSWDFSTLPQAIPDGRPSAHIIVYTDYANASAVSDLEDILYGDDANAASLPSPQIVYNLFDAYSILQIINNQDGTWTASAVDNGPDDYINGGKPMSTYPSGNAYDGGSPGSTYTVDISGGSPGSTYTWLSSIITMIDDVTFQINWPSAVFIDADSYSIHSE